MIHMEDVCKTYDKKTRAVKHVSFDIEPGEFVFIVGDSGSGKTTLLKLLQKELEPTSGRIIVDGEDIGELRKKDLPYYRRKMGVIFQDFRLLKDRDVYENVAFAMRVQMRSPRDIREDVPKLLRLVGLSAKYKMYPKELSGGEQQRVAIARALINGPDLLLADEPTGNMDPDNAWHIMRLLEKINEMGTTVVVVTHSKEIVDKMQKRVLTMRHGVLVSDEERGGYLQ